jgi:hypothetical protein
VDRRDDRRVPIPPPIAHNVRDLLEHPPLVSAKVHLNEPKVDMLNDIAARTRRNERLDLVSLQAQS